MESLAQEIAALRAREARAAIDLCSSPATLNELLELEANRPLHARRVTVVRAVVARLADFVAEPPSEALLGVEGAGASAAESLVAPAPSTPVKGVQRTCPKCSVHASGEEEVERVFGFRNVKRKNSEGEVVKVHRLPQSYCRECRSKAKKRKA